MIAISYPLPQPIALGDVGIYIDPIPAVHVAAGLADQVGLQFAFAMPGDAALRGTVLGFQGVALVAAQLRFSGAALWIVR